MFYRILLENDSLRVLRGLFGGIRVELRLPRPRVVRALPSERAYFNAAADEFERRGRLSANNQTFQQFVEEFAYAVSARGDVTWTAFFREIDPATWASSPEVTVNTSRTSVPSEFDQYEQGVYAAARKDVDERGLTTNGYPLPLDLEVEAFVFANSAFQTHLSWEQRPRLTFIGDKGWAAVRYPIAELGEASGRGEYVRIWVETKPNGGLQVIDYGMGPTAEIHSGGGSGIEASLSLTPEQARALFIAMGGWGKDTEVRIALRLAIGFAVKYAGDIRATSRIREFCESHGINPTSYVNFERD